MGSADRKPAAGLSAALTLLLWLAAPPGQGAEAPPPGQAPAAGAPRGGDADVQPPFTSCGSMSTREPGVQEVDPLSRRTIPLLTSDEPNRIGWTRDVYEKQGFLDFTLSMRYPILFETFCEGYRYNMLPFFAFTGRAGQYFDRHSSPVVSKRFNPRFFLRFYEPTHASDKKLWRDDNGLDYFDVGYGHESDGQSVDTQALYDAAVAAYGSPLIAQDYISRGWDYVGYTRHLQMHSHGLDSVDLDLRYFLAQGLLQKGIEEYHAWEAPSNITRISQVDGLRLRFNFGFLRDWFNGANLLLMTGYRDLGRHPTLRAEAGFTPLSRFLGVPVVVWWQNGYRSNVAQFYRSPGRWGSPPRWRPSTDRAGAAAGLRRGCRLHRQRV